MRLLRMIAATATLASFMSTALPLHAATSSTTEAAIAVEEARADAWLGSLQAQLAPTAAQMGAFHSYADAIRAQAKLKAEHRTAGLFVGTAQLPPAPEALQQEVTRLQERATALAKVQAAAAALYAELTAQQRTAFDFLAMTPTGLGTDAL